jgi:hypothetical protein
MPLDLVGAARENMRVIFGQQKTASAVKLA